MFSGFYLTTKGKALLAKVHTGSEMLEFTRFQVGKGSVASGTLLESMTKLVDGVGYFPVASVRHSANSAIVSFQLTNVGITNGWYFREVGLFANDPTDGEILYAYGNAGNDAELIPASTTSLCEYLFSLNCAIGNAQNVTAVIDSGMIYATKVDVEVAIEQVVGDAVNKVIGGKADKSKNVVVSIGSGNWVGNSAPYTVVVASDLITASNNLMIGLAENATDIQREAARMAEIHCTAQNSGSVTLAADGVKPNVDLPVSIVVLG